MPAPAPASAFAPGAVAPVRRVVTILQAKIDSLEKQRSKTKDNDDDPSQLLEFAWDLVKQVMGIAVLSENEAKKQARKDAALRKSQDLQLVHNALIVLNCVKRLGDPSTKADVLSGRCGAGITEEDFEAIDRLYPELSPESRFEDDDGSTFESRSLEAAKHLLAIVEADDGEAFGTTYARLKSIVTAARETGCMNRPRTPEPEEIEERPSPPAADEPIEEPEPIAVCALPPPAPQSVPAPTFAMMPPQAPPVTLQQIEQAYFAQYGHRQRPAPPPAPEVIGPQSFIFLQDSELDGADAAQQPPPVADSPTTSAIPSQTFTNQTYVAPPHFVPDPMQNPLVAVVDVPQPVHYAAAVVDVVPALVGTYPPPNPPMPIPPTHQVPLAGPPNAQGVVHPHPVRQQRLPSPFRQNVAFKPQPSHPTESPPNAAEEPNPEEVQPAPEREWAEMENHGSEQLEIDEWNPGESGDRTNGQASDKFRSRGRGRSSGNYRGRGGYQNGRSGNYYRNNDGYQSGGGNSNGRNYNENYRERNDGNRYENSQGGYQENYRGRGVNGRGSYRQNGGTRGAPRGGSQSRGAAGARPHYNNRKPANGNQFETRNGVDNKQQSFAN